MKELSGIGKRECIISQNVIVTNFLTICHGGYLRRLLTKAGDSYKDLPKNLYQIQLKFRDECRPRFGLLRGINAIVVLYNKYLRLVVKLQNAVMCEIQHARLL